MDRNELLNDNESALRSALDGRQAIMWTALPCTVNAVNFVKMTISAQPCIQANILLEDGNIRAVDLPLLEDVPIVFPSAGGFTITFPIAIGDEVLVLFASRCIDGWWQNGGAVTQRALEARMHDLSDGFAIPGPKSVPNVIPNISNTDLEIRNDSGLTLISITATGKIGFENSITNLKTLLTNLESLLNVFMTVLAGFSGGATPVTQVSLQVPAAAAVASLATVLTEIGALLK